MLLERFRTHALARARGTAYWGMACRGVLSAGLLAAGVAPLQAALVEVTIVAQEGDAPIGGDGNLIDGLNSPFTNGDGIVGFTGSLDLAPGSDTFVWFDDQIIWRGTDEPLFGLTGGEGTMGISDLMDYIYSPSVDGNDAVWTGSGALLVKGSPAPGFPVPFANTFNSRPTMTPGGTAHWIAGYDEEGGGSSDGRVLYRASGGLPANIEIVIQPGDLVGGLAISDGSGIDFDYSVSDDLSHHIHPLVVESGDTSTDEILYVDGNLVAQESMPNSDGDNWQNFDNVAINNNGDYLVSGDSDGDSGSDEFVAVNGVIAIREGDTVDGVELLSSASVQGVAINNNGEALYQWNYSGGETLFLASDLSDLAGSSVALLSVNDEVDTNGDGLADATVVDLNASGTVGPGLSLAETGPVYVGVDLDDGTSEFEAILALTGNDEGLTLSVTGTCPGLVTLTITGGSDGGSLAILNGSGFGTDAVPGGPCSGTPTGLSGIGLLGIVGLDGSGAVTITRDLPLPACGIAVEALDVNSCSVSGATTL